MNRIMRYISALLCLVLVTTSVPVFAESEQDATLNSEQGLQATIIPMDIEDEADPTSAPETVDTAPETTTVAPETTTVAPETTTVAPETTTVAPETTTAAPETDGLIANNVTVYSNDTKTIYVTDSKGNRLNSNDLTFKLVDSNASQYFYVTASGEVCPIVHDGLFRDGYAAGFEVRVEYRDKSTTVDVKLRQAYTGVSVKNDSYIGMSVGQSLDYAAKLDFKPSSADDSVVGWASSDTSVFTVDSNGKLKAIKEGSATLTIATRSGATLSVPVVVKWNYVEPTPAPSPVPTTAAPSASVAPTVTPAPSESPASSESPAPTIDPNATVDPNTTVDPNATIDPNATVDPNATIDPNATVDPNATPTPTPIPGVIPVTYLQLYKGVFDDKTDFTVGQGKTLKLVVDTLPADATVPGYYLTAHDNSIVSISGVTIKGVRAGKTLVTITSMDGNVSRDVTITVVPKNNAVTSFKLNYSSLSMYEGTTKTVKVKINSSAFDKTVIWSSTDEAVATVDDGVITAVAPGKCTIYAISAGGSYKSVKVTVKQQKPTKVRLNVTKGSIYPGEEYQFKATIYPANVIDPEMQKLTWTSSNTDVAIVTNDGYLYAIAPGRATITVRTANGKYHRCYVTVKARKASSVTIINPYTQFLVGGTYDLDAIVTPDDATDTSVKWSTSSSSRASIDKKTGVLKCKRTGTVKITAKANDGSGKKQTITINIVSIPLKSSTVSIGGMEMTEGSVYTLNYKQTATIFAASDPVLDVTYHTSDKRVVAVNNGVLTATGCGDATITVYFGGQYARKFTVTVPYDPAAPRYRALVISQYTNSKDKGYLPFSTNSTNGVIDALELSDLDGSRYDVTYKKDFTTAGQVINSINTTFAGTKPGDVSVIYIITHGVLDNGNFRWMLKGSGKKTVYLEAADVMGALKGIKGDVVLVVLSCYSGGDVTNNKNLTGMIRSLDDAAGEGCSYSVICASDGTKRASYADTASSFSYDFFTHGLCQALGWDLTTSQKVAAVADKNGDGKITLKELAQATEVLTKEECAEFIDKYGDSAYWGPAEQTQDVSYYLSPDASDVPVYAY